MYPDCIVYSSDEIYWFKDNDLTVKPQLIAKVKNIQNISISPDNTFLIVFNTTGGIFKVSIQEKNKQKKYALAGKPISAQMYMQSCKIGITADIRGNVFCVDFEKDIFWKIFCDKSEAYYAIFPSVKANCFLMQGVDCNDNTFIRKYIFDNAQIKVLDEVCFGDRVLAEANLCVKRKELLFFIDCQDKIFGLYSYNENTHEIKKHFTLAMWDELWQIISCYVSIRFSDEYNCFVIARSDKIQLFDINGTCMKEFRIPNGNIGIDFVNAPYDAYIFNGKLYINTIIGVYEEDMK